jgi:transcriptional regulator with XRE-family HTH domain
MMIWRRNLMRIYREFPSALRKVIAVTQGGNQSDFAEVTGMTAASVSRLCAGTREITRDTLEKISRHLPEAERRRLYLAAMRDFLPDEAHDMFFASKEKKPLMLQEDEADYSVIDPETHRILEWLNRQASRQEEVRAWLRTLGKWIRPTKMD